MPKIVSRIPYKTIILATQRFWASNPREDIYHIFYIIFYIDFYVCFRPNALYVTLDNIFGPTYECELYGVFAVFDI